MFLLKFCLNHLHRHLISRNSNSPIFYAVPSWTGDHFRSILRTPLEEASWQDPASQQVFNAGLILFWKAGENSKNYINHHLAFNKNKRKPKRSDSKIPLVMKAVPTVLKPQLQPTMSQSLRHFCFLRCLIWKIFFSVCSFYPCLCSQSACWRGGCNFSLFWSSHVSLLIWESVCDISLCLHSLLVSCHHHLHPSSDTKNGSFVSLQMTKVFKGFHIFIVCI